MTLTTPTRAFWATPRFTIDTLHDGWASWQNVTTSSGVWGTANRAVYIPIGVKVRVTVVSLGFANGTTATGNIDIGLYDAAGVRLVSSGSTAKGTGNEITVMDVTDTTIGPGLYYLALNNDTTTDTFIGTTADTPPYPASRGLLVEALGAVTLPATASWSIDNTLAIAPTLTALLNTVVT